MKRTVLLAAIGFAAALGHAGTAAAAVTCTSSGSYPNASVTILLTGNGSVAGLKVGASHELLVNDASCSPKADLRKGPVVGVTAPGSASNRLSLDLAGGAFRDTTHHADIFFAADLGSGFDYLDVYGGSANDFIVAGQTGINLNAGETNPQYDVLPLNFEMLQLYGLNGADVLSAHGGYGSGGPASYAFANLSGNGGNDAIFGSPHDDYLDGGSGDDSLNGLGGVDTATYAGAVAAVTVSLTTETSSGGDGADTLTKIEDLRGSNYDDVLVGNGGSNHLKGYFGNDFLEGGLGADVLDGEVGTDWVSYFGASGGVYVNLQSGAASGAAGADTLSGFENALGSPFADLLLGDSQANSIAGVAGNDNLFGVDGNDALAGGDGNDAENGGNGTDSCQNGPGTDIRTDCES